jgi:hypothetical protein
LKNRKSHKKGSTRQGKFCMFLIDPNDPTQCIFVVCLSLFSEN